MSKFIKLNSVKYPGLECIVDDEDYDELIKYNWHPKIYLKDNVCYAAMWNHGHPITIHIFIMKYHEHNINNQDIDHKDHNGLNNQKENLRICTKSQNHYNTNKHRGNKTSEYKGVSFDKHRNKWFVQLKFDNKNIYIGRFDKEKDAGLAYNKKAIEVYGDYAHLNNIKDGI